MRHFNADGGPATLCINGTRCAARLALELGWATDELVIDTGAGAVPARRTDNGEIDLGAGEIFGELAAIAIAPPLPNLGATVRALESHQRTILAPDNRTADGLGMAK